MPENGEAPVCPVTSGEDGGGASSLVGEDPIYNRPNWELSPFAAGTFVTSLLIHADTLMGYGNHSPHLHVCPLGYPFDFTVLAMPLVRLSLFSLNRPNILLKLGLPPALTWITKSPFFASQPVYGPSSSASLTKPLADYLSTLGQLFQQCLDPPLRPRYSPSSTLTNFPYPWRIRSLFRPRGLFSRCRIWLLIPSSRIEHWRIRH